MPNQFTLTWALVIALAISASSGWFGWQVCDWRADAAIAELKLQHAKEIGQRDADIATANANTQTANDSARNAIDSLTRNFVQEKSHDQNEIARLKRDVLVGDQRLSIAVTRCATTTAASDGNSTAATGVTETRADIDPRVGESLIGITERGDSAIKELNFCIDSYNAVRDRFDLLHTELNKQKTH